MSYVVLVLLLASVLAGIGGLAAMVVKKEPFYGAAGLFVICCPSAVLAVAYVAVA
ncbi:hypothetical protein [Nocardia sp. NRRL S-836]|uniref:hypothetical protein n=1 Tax=Nocardia sp. NRRL S-836 TaxID=1519492 RepID=UPI000ACFA85E|nr:hypothetical protein [Nocardia sp. NRRL S-836]